jgi:hypothetical protein
MKLDRNFRSCVAVAAAFALTLAFSGASWATGGHTQVGFGLAPTPIDIAVYTKDDKPIANAIVVVKSPGAFETTYRTDKDGLFTAMVPCHTKDSKSITHEVVVTHDKYKTTTGTFTTEEGACDKNQKIILKMEPK